MFKSPKDKQYLSELGGGVLLVELIIVAGTLDVYGFSPAGVGLAVFMLPSRFF